jgi:hypothetical protein
MTRSAENKRTNPGSSSRHVASPPSLPSARCSVAELEVQSAESQSISSYVPVDFWPDILIRRFGHGEMELESKGAETRASNPRLNERHLQAHADWRGALGA